VGFAARGPRTPVRPHSIRRDGTSSTDHNLENRFNDQLSTRSDFPFGPGRLSCWGFSCCYSRSPAAMVRNPLDSPDRNSDR